MEGKGHRKMTLFSYLCIHTDTRPGTKILMNPLYLCFCSCSPCSEIAPGDPILLSFWTLSSLQDSWNSVLFIKMGFSGGSNGKESTGNAGDPGLIPGSGRSRGKGNGDPCQSSCLEKSYGQRSLGAGYSPWGHTESA